MDVAAILKYFPLDAGKHYFLKLPEKADVEDSEFDILIQLALQNIDVSEKQPTTSIIEAEEVAWVHEELFA